MKIEISHFNPRKFDNHFLNQFISLIEDSNVLDELTTFILSKKEENDKSNCTTSEVKETIIENPNTSLESIFKFSQDTDMYSRAKVAELTRTPTSILNTLSYDSEYFVLSTLIDNPNITLECFERMVERILRNDIKFNESPAEIEYFIERFMNHHFITEEQAAKLENWLNDFLKTPKVSELEKLNHQFKIFETLAQSNDSAVLLGLILNENIPTEILNIIKAKLSNGQIDFTSVSKDEFIQTLTMFE